MLLLVLPNLSLAQQPVLKINSYGSQLQLAGPTNRYYQIQYSKDLVNWSPAWGSWGKKFLLTNSPSYHEFGWLNVTSLFYRAEAFFVSAANLSYADTCAEHDNVNVALTGPASEISITATHPTNYLVTDYSCSANFSGCGTETGTNYSFTPFQQTVNFSGGYVVVSREASFWRPQGMRVLVQTTPIIDDAHIIKIGTKIPGADEWPQYFVLYSDGYLRLIPFPPAGQLSVCFGSSIIVGPAAIAERPFADIKSVQLLPSNKTLLVTYRSGGTATLTFGDVSRTSATVNVKVGYSTDQSLCTFRSMYVADGNSDCDRVQWRDLNGATAVSPIMSLPTTTATEWFFYRQTRSSQRQSAPDIRITVH